MAQPLQYSDFDFQIEDILLVHRNTHLPNFKWTQYRAGRETDGLVFCLDGSAQYDFNTFSFTLSAGQALFLPASSLYTMKSCGSIPFVHYTANFLLCKPELSDFSPLNEIFHGNLYHITDPTVSALYSGLFEKLLSAWLGKTGGYRVMSRALLYELLYLYFTDAARAQRSRTDYNKLKPAIHALDTAYTEDTSVAQLAALCGLSETHFRRLFVKLLGTTPTEYRIHKRILRAKDLLMSGQYTVAETARAAGFRDASYFSRVFRAHTGTSPRSFTEV